MAEQDVTVKAELEIDKKALKNNLKTALGSFKGFATKATKFLGAMSVAALFKSGLETAIAEEQAQIKIGTILRNRFGQENDIRNTLEAQANALASQSIFRRNEIQAAQEALLLNLKGTDAVEAATKSAILLTTAINGAGASAGDLASNAKSIAEALRYGNFQQFENLFSGQIGLSQEQISTLSQFNTETERANALLQIMKGNFGETAGEVANSFSGAMKETIGRFQDFATSIAKQLLPVLISVFDLINAISDAFGGLENIMIAFMVFMLGKMVYGFIATTLPALLGMGIAQAFAQGGPIAALAAVGIAASIGGAVGAGIAGILALKGEFSGHSKNKTSNAEASTKLSNTEKADNARRQINIHADIRTGDPIAGVVAKAKDYS